MLTQRGFGKRPAMPSIVEACKLRAGAIAAEPMYRGLATLGGIDVVRTGSTFADEVATLKDEWVQHDFFFLQFKPADAAGEDGDFQAKIRALEEYDTHAEALHSMQADVMIVAGDHSTPSVLS